MHITLAVPVRVTTRLPPASHLHPSLFCYSLPVTNICVIKWIVIGSGIYCSLSEANYYLHKCWLIFKWAVKSESKKDFLGSGSSSSSRRRRRRRSSRSISDISIVINNAIILVVVLVGDVIIVVIIIIIATELMSASVLFKILYSAFIPVWGGFVSTWLNYIRATGETNSTGKRRENLKRSLNTRTSSVAGMHKVSSAISYKVVWPAKMNS